MAIPWHIQIPGMEPDPKRREQPDVIQQQLARCALSRHNQAPGVGLQILRRDLCRQVVEALGCRVGPGARVVGLVRDILPLVVVHVGVAAAASVVVGAVVWLLREHQRWLEQEDCEHRQQQQQQGKRRKRRRAKEGSHGMLRQQCPRVCLCDTRKVWRALMAATV